MDARLAANDGFELSHKFTSGLLVTAANAADEIRERGILCHGEVPEAIPVISYAGRQMARPANIVEKTFLFVLIPALARDNWVGASS
jgi:hypothetical protein